MSDDGWSGCRDERDPPVPVWVDLRRVFPPGQVGPRRELLAWHLTASGERWAQVRVELVNRNQRGRLVADTFAPEEAVARRSPDEA